jgi:hypothetical protein
MLSAELQLIIDFQLSVANCRLRTIEQALNITAMCIKQERRNKHKHQSEHLLVFKQQVDWYQ